jgi:MoaA/NifB/PqqE/SkfB family radical SAM enzyme
MLRYKGIRCIYNYLWYQILYAHQGVLAKILWTKLYPFFIHLPRLLEVEVTTFCPLKCVICEHTYWKEEPRNMTFEQFKHIISQFPKLKWIGLTGIGESFVNKDFLKMLEYIKRKNIYVELYDNFYFIDAKAADALVYLSVDKIFISLDAATKETYEKVRAGANFDTVINNIRRLLELRRFHNTPYPELSYHFIINKININEVVQFLDLVKSLTGTESSVIFTRLLHDYPQVNQLTVDVSEALMKEVTKRAKELGIRVGWNANVPVNKPSISECSFWIMPFIFVTGEVIACCAGNEANRRDFQKQHSFGNIFQENFIDIWNSKRYRAIRKLIHNGTAPAICLDCQAFKTK